MHSSITPHLAHVSQAYAHVVDPILSQTLGRSSRSWPVVDPSLPPSEARTLVSLGICLAGKVDREPIIISSSFGRQTNPEPFLVYKEITPRYGSVTLPSYLGASMAPWKFTIDGIQEFWDTFTLPPAEQIISHELHSSSSARK